jgi:hypothetical protein
MQLLGEMSMLQKERSTNAGLIELIDCELNEVSGGTIGAGATLGAFRSIGGFTETLSPSPGSFVQDTAFGALLPAIGVAATVLSGGTVPLLVAGAALQDS